MLELSLFISSSSVSKQFIKLSYLHGNWVHVLEDNVTRILVIEDSGNRLGYSHPALGKRNPGKTQRWWSGSAGSEMNWSPGYGSVILNNVSELFINDSKKFKKRVKILYRY
jgi:hypothetical protein